MRILKLMVTVLIFAVMLIHAAFAEAYIPSVEMQDLMIDAGIREFPVNVSALSGSNGQFMNGFASQVVRLVNEEREKYGLEPLRVDVQLTAAASVRAKEIVGRFSHTRPDGTKWSTVSAAARGENIARGHTSADRVMAAWMTSEGHRANILRESFGSIGVCALQVNGVMHWVQIFGK